MAKNYLHSLTLTHFKFVNYTYTFCDPTLTFKHSVSPKLYTHTTLVETGIFSKIISRGLIMIIFLNI
jgi:hypothetical protein